MRRAKKKNTIIDIMKSGKKKYKNTWDEKSIPFLIKTDVTAAAKSPWDRVNTIENKIMIL
tara:strand:- start:107 stop:286 length:180 start_codon:yes stop_codon:yes gene_type:complete